MNHRSMGRASTTLLAASLVAALGLATPVFAQVGNVTHSANPLSEPKPFFDVDNDPGRDAILLTINGVRERFPAAYGLGSIGLYGPVFSVRHGVTPRGNAFLIGGQPVDGSLNFESGHYSLAPNEATPGTAWASYAEPIPSPPGFTGFVSFDRDGGTLDLHFNEDRTRVRGKVVAYFSDHDGVHGRRTIYATFDVPNIDITP